MGSPIKEAREAAGLSQQKLAELCQVSTLTIHRWEAGISTPHPVIREKLTRVLRSLDKVKEARKHEEELKKDVLNTPDTFEQP